MGSKCPTYLGTDKPKLAFKAMRMDESEHKLEKMRKREKKNLIEEGKQECLWSLQTTKQFPEKVVISCDK